MRLNVRKIARTGAVTILLVVAGLAFYTWRHVSPAAPTYSPGHHVDLPFRLRDLHEHDAARERNGGNPYVLTFELPNGGALLYYGASHTRDPKDPQVADITARWKVFQPTVALYEGRARNHVFGALIEPFAGLPEPALVHKLARRDDVTLFSLEPSYAEEVAALTLHFSAEQVALYFFLRVYVSEAGGQANDALALDLLHKRTDVDGLRGTLGNLADVTRVWKENYPEMDDWRFMDHEPESGTLAEISSESRRVRGEHMPRVLIDLVGNGERVFAVVGSGHVIRQEWNLRSAFDLEPAWDQPQQSVPAAPGAAAAVETGG
jgi:hypothetical protein